MFISKKGAKLMAFVLAFTFVLTGLAYAPNKAKAAGEKPTVRVLGATLRLSDDENAAGNQSLRVAIEVSNANQAKGCAINIATATKSVKIATDDSGNKKHTDMYSVDTVNNKVVYSAVITGIPKDKIDTDFKVTGTVTAIGDVATEPSKEVTKSVKGVVETLQKKDPAITIVNGVLKKGDAPLTASDIDFKPSDSPDVYTVDITKFVKGWVNENGGEVPASVTVNSNGTVKIDWSANAKNYSGAVLPMSGVDLSEYEYMVVDATGSSSSVIIKDSKRKKKEPWGETELPILLQYGVRFDSAFKYKFKESDLHDSYQNDSGNWVLSDEPRKDTTGKYADFTNADQIIIQKGTETTAMSLTIKSIKFYKNEADIPA